MWRSLVLSGLVLLGCAQALRAADPDGYYTIQGVGIESCEAWLSERQADGAIAWYHEQWVLGYITAVNRWVHEESDVAVGIESAKLFEWIDEYCHRNPQENLSLATEALLWALDQRP